MFSVGFGLVFFDFEGLVLDSEFGFRLQIGFCDFVFLPILAMDSELFVGF